MGSGQIERGDNYCTLELEATSVRRERQNLDVDVTSNKTSNYLCEPASERDPSKAKKTTLHHGTFFFRKGSMDQHNNPSTRSTIHLNGTEAVPTTHSSSFQLRVLETPNIGASNFRLNQTNFKQIRCRSQHGQAFSEEIDLHECC